jgi:putative transposase
MYKFTKWYDEEHRHSGIKFTTPYQRHNGFDVNILANRAIVYEKSTKLNPEHWSKNIRCWEKCREVHINPVHEKPAA